MAGSDTHPPTNSAVESLGPDEVHVWLTDPDQITDPALLKRYAGLMDSEESQRQQRFRLEKLRHDFLVARALVRTTLSRYANAAPEAWQFQSNAYGRPEILRPPLPSNLRFNLSHTRSLAACAVAWNCELGVDVEAIDRRNSGMQIAQRFFAPAEVDELISFPPADQPTRFFDYWTLKESYIKARGMGLAIPLDQFSFCLRGGSGATITFSPPLVDAPDHWQFFQASPTPRHRLALAVRRPRRDPLKVAIRWVVPPA